MKSRERVLKALRHEETDRVPVFTTLTPQAADACAEKLGMEKIPALDSLLSTRISHAEILLKLGNDCVGIASCAPRSFPTKTLKDGTIINDWGMKFKPAGLYNEFVEFPLSNAETKADLDKYTFPDPLAEGRYDHAVETVKKYSGEYAIVADLECAMYETSWYLVGLEKFLGDLAMKKEYTLALLDRVLDINITTGKKLIEIGADVIWAGDDFGTQNGLLMSPTMWRDIFKPRYKRMFDEFKKLNPDIKIAFHTCGSVLPIIPDFIDIGLDILNPIQPNAQGMDAGFLKKTYGDKLSFFGGIDIQKLLPFGTPEEIKKVVKEKISILGKGGGYILAPAHNVQADTSVENIQAMYEAVRS